MKKLISILTYVILLILIIVFVRNNYEDFLNIPKISFFYFSIMLILSLIALYFNGIRIKLFGDYYNITLKLKEWFGLAAVTTMGNYLTPFRAGVAARAVYLKKMYNFSYTSFLTTITASYVVRFLIYGLMGILVLVIIYLNYNFFNLLGSLFFIVVFLGTIFVLLFAPSFSKSKNKFFNWIIKIVNEWKLMSKNPMFLLKLGLVELIFMILLGIRLIFAYKAFNLDITGETMFIIFLISIFSTISIYLGITPGGLGITELIITLFSKLIGFTATQGLYVALLDRLASIIIVFILGPIFSYFLLRKVNDNSS
tara:strand:- start:6535 stop:7467 length:933 start_codon:yes stop_codon:yes gene_type:complete